MPANRGKRRRAKGDVTTWGEEIRGAAAAQTREGRWRSERRGKHSSAGGLSSGPPSAPCWACRLGQARGCGPRLCLPACKERASHGQWGCSSAPRPGVGLLRAGGGQRRFRGCRHHGAWTPVLHFCSPLPSAWRGVSPLHPCLGGLLAAESPFLCLGSPTLTPRQQLARGPSDAQRRHWPRSRTKGCPGTLWDPRSPRTPRRGAGEAAPGWEQCFHWYSRICLERQSAQTPRLSSLQ